MIGCPVLTGAREAVAAQAGPGSMPSAWKMVAPRSWTSHRAVPDVSADAVRFAEDGSAADAGPRENGGPTRRPMLPARILIRAD